MGWDEEATVSTPGRGGNYMVTTRKLHCGGAAHVETSWLKLLWMQSICRCKAGNNSVITGVLVFIALVNIIIRKSLN